MCSTVLVHYIKKLSYDRLDNVSRDLLATNTCVCMDGINFIFHLDHIILFHNFRFLDNNASS